MELSKLVFTIIISSISISAEDEKGCKEGMKKQSEGDCIKWLELLGASTQYNPESITFQSYLFCARVLNEECNAIISYEDLNKEEMLKLIVRYNDVDYFVNTYKDEAATELDYDDGDDDDDDDDSEDGSDEVDSPQRKSNGQSS